MGKDGTATTERGAITPNNIYTESQNTASIDDNEKGQEALKDREAELGIEASSDMLSVDEIGNGDPLKKISETKPSVNMSDDYKDVDDDIQKPDWILTRLEGTYATDELMSLYGAEGFTDFNSVDDYWEDPAIKKRFVDKFGFSAKREFSKVYDNLKAEFSNYQLNRFSRGVTAYELAKDDLSKLAIGATFEYMNKDGSVMEGFEWGAASRDVRQSAKKIRHKDGTLEDYSPELLASLEMEEGFDGLAYSDSTLHSDPKSSDENSYFDVIYDGQITLADNTTRRVKDDAIVSRWDINTGSALDGWFNNNKLEADSPWDYAKILVRGVDKMWYDVMDTMLMVPKLALTASYGVAGWFTEDDPDVLGNEFYKAITSMQVRNAGSKPSITQEAMRDGFFHSAESFLSTVFDIGLQVSFGAALGKLGRGVGKIVSRKATPEAALAAQQAWAKNTVRSTLTAYAAKDSYNEALDNGFSVDEATMITGATIFALWKATALADYMVGEYEPKVLRETIGKIIKKEQQTFLKDAFKRVVEVGAKGTEQKALLSLKTMTKALDKVFAPMKNLVKGTRPGIQRMLYEAKQEGLEEMSEELYQDLVKQGFTAYGAITQKITGERQGGYMSIFEEGYFKDAAERYATSGIAGGLGGPMGMVNQRINLSSITDSSSIVDIIAGGNKDQLLDVLRDMKTNGELGPDNLSNEYNEELSIFEPILKGTEGATTLSDMVYNTYLYDIATIDNFVSKGMFGEARKKIEQDSSLKDYVEGNAMRKDFGVLMGKMLELHQKTGISTGIYPEMDAMQEEDLVDYMPQEVKDRIDKGNNELKEIRERIENRKALAENKLAPTDDDTPETTLKEPIVDPKEEEDESNLQRLEKEIQLSSSVTSKDLTDLFGLYRKVRAIANGTASEHYFMQHSMYEDTTFGDMRVRDEQFKYLGKNAFSDQLMAMRNRALDDKKMLVYKKQQALETEDSLNAITDNTDEGIISLLQILDKVPADILTREANTKVGMFFLENLEKFTGPLSIQYDPDNEESMFKRNEDGTVDDEDVLDKFLTVLETSMMNEGIRENTLFLNHIAATDAAKNFFRGFSANPLDHQIPTYETSPYDQTIVEEGKVTDGSAYDLIASFGGSAAGPIQDLPRHITALRKAHIDAKNRLLTFSTGATQIRNVRSLFNTGKGVNHVGQYEIGNIKLIDSAASAGTMFLSNKLPGDIFYQKDSTDVDHVLEQIKIKEAITKELSKYGNMRGKAALASLRKNVLEILNFTYNTGEEPSSRVEKHSYKDYSEVTDFFVDFIGDPIKAYEIGSKELKGEPLNTDEQEFSQMNGYNMMLLNASYIKKADPDIEGGNDRVQLGEIDKDALHRFLSDSFSGLAGSRDIEKALSFMREVRVEVPGDIITGGDATENITLFTDGITQLKIAEWVMKGLKEKIDTAADISNATPYIQDKENDIDTTFTIFDDMLGAPGMELVQQYVEEYVTEPGSGYKGMLDSTIKTEKARVNIGIEKALYDIYNDKVSLDGPDAGTVKSVIDNYVNKVFARGRAGRAGNESGSASVMSAAILIGAITTDYTTTFYPKFKAYISNSTDEDPIVLAAQEHSAKYAASYVFSRKFKEKIDEVVDSRFKNEQRRHLLAVLGTAGSGKTTAVTRLGMTLGIDILKDMGYTNTGVLPVSNNQDQVDLLNKSLGDLSGDSGLLVEGLYTLLEDANSGDEEAIARLKKTAVILIDEVTYIDARDVSNSREDIKRKSYLTKLTDLIEAFNSKHASANNPISLVVMGDPKQSGAHDPTKSTMTDTSLQPNNIMALSYMGHSFRNNNSFLVDSLKSLEPKADSTLFIPPGVKYGTSNGKYYGVNMVSPANKDTDSEFQSILNDDKLIENIRKNIKSTEEENTGKEEGDKKAPFTVMIVVTSKVEWEGMSNKMKKLYEEFPDNFKIRAYNGVGGAEANYVIGEFPAEPFGPQEYLVSTYTKGLRKGLNTLASRAFDYAYIINRNKDIQIPVASRTKNMGDGQVVIPDNSISQLAKQKVKEMYEEIFADIDESAVSAVDEDAPEGTVVIEVNPADPDDSNDDEDGSDEPGSGEKDENAGGNVMYSGSTILRTSAEHIQANPESVTELSEYYDMLYNYYSGVEGATFEQVSEFYNVNKDILGSYTDIDLVDDIFSMTDPQAIGTKIALINYKATIFGINPAFFLGIDEKTGADNLSVLHNLEAMIKEDLGIYKLLIDGSRIDPASEGYRKMFYRTIQQAHWITIGGKPGGDIKVPRLSKFHKGKDISEIFEALLGVHSAEEVKVEVEEIVDDKLMEDANLDKFTLWLQGITPDGVLNVIKQLKNITGELVLNDSADVLFRRFPTKHAEIIEELMRRAIGIKGKNIAEANKKLLIEQGADESFTPDNDFSLLADYKRLLGIDPSIITVAGLHQAITGVQADSVVHPDLYKGNVLTALSDIPNVWRRLFGAKHGTLSNHALNGEGRDEFIARISQLRNNETIALLPNMSESVLKYNRSEVRQEGEDGFKRTVLTDKAAVLGLFNFDDKAQNLADGLELRGVKNAKGYIQVFLVVTQGDNRYVVAHLNNDLYKDKRDKETQEAYKISDETIEAFDAQFRKSPGVSVIDITIKGSPKSNLFIRSGEVIMPHVLQVRYYTMVNSYYAGEGRYELKAIQNYYKKHKKQLQGLHAVVNTKSLNPAQLEEKAVSVRNTLNALNQGAQTITIRELMDQGINFSSSIYVNTEKKKNQSGESYLLYSWNKGIALGTDSHKDLLEKGIFSDGSKGNILDDSGVVPTEIGHLPLIFKPSLGSLKKAVTDIQGVSFPQFASRFSLAMQKLLSDDIINSVNDKENPDFSKSAKIRYYSKSNIDSDGNIINELDPKFIVEQEMTTALYEKAKAMRAGYDNHIETLKLDDLAKGTAVEKGILEALGRMREANAAGFKRTNVDVLAIMVGAFKINNLIKRNNRNPNDIIVKESKNSDVYIFNLSAYLKNHSVDLLNKVDTLFSVSSSPIHMPISVGTNKGVIGIADPKIMELFADSLFLKNVEGIAKPGLVINSEGIAMINTAINNRGQSKPANLNRSEKIRSESIFKGTYNSTLDIMEKGDLINEQVILNNIKKKLKLANATSVADMNKIEESLDMLAMGLLNIASVVDSRLATLFPGMDISSENMSDAVTIASNLYSLLDLKVASGDTEMVANINKVLGRIKIFKNSTADKIMATLERSGMPTEIINMCKF